ncbi:MAG: hypothetical protein J6S40_06870 [Thermoguttaceae bacterium]|nr:hypothetical protein [Thermoguttaceae bacterium]
MSSQSVREIHEKIRYIHGLYRQLKTLAARYNNAQLRVRVQKKKTAEAEARYAELKAELDKMHAEIREAEGRYGLIDAALQKRKTQLDQAKNNKEYTSLKDQIADDQRRNDALADEILAQAEKAEEFAPRVAEAESQIEPARKAQAAVEKELRDLVPELRESSEHIQSELRQKIKEVDVEFAPPLREALRAFDGDQALAPVEGEYFCGGCRMEIPMQYIVALCEGKPYTCGSCGRFIYLPKDFTINNEDEDD